MSASDNVGDSQGRDLNEERQYRRDKAEYTHERDEPSAPPPEERNRNED